MKGSDLAVKNNMLKEKVENYYIILYIQKCILQRNIRFKLFGTCKAVAELYTLPMKRKVLA